MTWREEKDLIRTALDSLLPFLERPILSVPLGDRLAGITGVDPKRCRTVLGWLAHDGHPNATHDGGEVRSYGRVVTRWRWHPTPQHVTAVNAASVRLENWASSGVYERPVDEETPEAYRARIVAEGARREALAQDLQSAKANVSDEDW